MTLQDRYLKGETVSVYENIYKLGEDAFSSKYYTDVENVLTETFKRVAYNLNIIHKELIEIGYPFKSNVTYNFEQPLTNPLPDIDSLLLTLENIYKPWGAIPVALNMFYKIVGACNFASTESNISRPWRLADPIQILSLDDILREVTSSGDNDYLNECYLNDGIITIEISADYLHKDDVSGGPAYSIPITKQQVIDPPLLNEYHNTTFINYLRICMNNCGFSRITHPDECNEYQAFFDRVKPKLMPI